MTRPMLEETDMEKREHPHHGYKPGKHDDAPVEDGGFTTQDDESGGGSGNTNPPPPKVGQD
jgi:hypothetical protein